MAGPVTIACPICGVAFTIPTEVVGVDEARHQVLLRCDRAELYGHLRECSTKHADKAAAALVAPSMAAIPPQATAEPVLPKAELRGRIDRFLVILETSGHLTRGDRACSMCGTPNETCLAGLKPRRHLLSGRPVRPPEACCVSCESGNTHPTAAEQTPCAEWAREHGAQD